MDPTVDYFDGFLGPQGLATRECPKNMKSLRKQGDHYKLCKSTRVMLPSRNSRNLHVTGKQNPHQGGGNDQHLVDRERQPVEGIRTNKRGQETKVGCQTNAMGQGSEFVRGHQDYS